MTALVYDGLCTFEFGIVAEIFGLPRPELGEQWYRFASAAVDPGPLRAHGGLVIVASGGMALIDQADIIVVPGWKGADVPVPAELVARLRRAHERGARLVSICSGAFVLAATGLLDGGTITTHWRYAEALRRRFPGVQIDDVSLYREHGSIFTSAGSAAGIDLLIELVRRDFGPGAANSVARRLVMPAHRVGGQAQFLERPVPPQSGSAVAQVLDHVRENLRQRWTIASMAGLARMSRRSFERRFAEATGSGPGEWLIGERVEAAKDMLIHTSRPMEVVAEAVGFGSAYALRHHFRNRVSVSPSAFRRGFQKAPS